MYSEETINSMNSQFRKMSIALATLSLGLVSLGLVSLASIPTSANAAPYLHGTPNPSGTPHYADHDVDTFLGGNVPTYFTDVEPIIVENCLTCHREGQIGYGTYPIDSYMDIMDNAEDIAYFVDIGYMPPWMPSADSPAFRHERGLTNDEINTVVAWYEGGTLLGDIDQRIVESLKEVPDTNIGGIEVDLELTMPEPYTPDATLTDDYRCFLLDPGFTEDTFVTGYQVLPDNNETVHHVIIYQVPADAFAIAEQKEAEDGRPGWECFGGTNLSGRRGGPMIGGWVPGSVPTEYMAGTGILVEASNYLVLQMHYNLANNQAADQSTIQLQLAEPSAEIGALRMLPMLAPVELPCPEGIDCSRASSMAEVNSSRSDYLLTQCGKTVDDYQDQPVDHIVSECDFRVPIAGYITSTLPHMHELGTTTRLELNPDSDSPQLLVDIPEWDFHWQGSYQYVDPIRVEVGDTIRITCVWDNSEGDRYVVWGERTSDEMCLNFITYLSDGQDKRQ